jgi:hypothetical protein
MSFLSTIYSNKTKDVPQPSDPDVEEQRRKRRLAQATAKGRQNTIAAGSGGVEDTRVLGKSVLTGVGGGA